MNVDSLLSVLADLHPLSSGFKKALTKELRLVRFPKNYMLIETPHVAQYVYFLEKGFAMSFTFNRNKKIVEEFWREGEILTSVTSFCEQIPTVENIQLMANSELLCLSIHSLQSLLLNFDEAQLLYNRILYEYFARSRNRANDIQRMSAAIRLENLLSSHPEIEQFVSQENIASYLGITPQSLSRVKRNR